MRPTSTLAIRVLRRVPARPGASSTKTTSASPGSGGTSSDSIEIDDGVSPFGWIGSALSFGHR